MFGSDDDPRADKGSSLVCMQEKGALERTKKRYKGKNPNVIEAAMRVEAACKPAPSGACAIARADVASANARYGRRSRATLAARRTEGKACAGAEAERDNDADADKDSDADGDNENAR